MHSRQQHYIRRKIARLIIRWRKTWHYGYLEQAAILAEIELEDEFLNWVIAWTRRTS